MTNQLPSSNIALLVVSIFLLVLTICGVVVIVYKRVKQPKSSLTKKEEEKLDPLDKEIRRYKKLQERYKQKILNQEYLDHDKRLKDMKEILDAELDEYKNDQLVKINQDIQKNKNDLLRETILNTMQPLHLKVINESSVHFLPINDKYKPLIIGKKGQNIKKLNEITNCNINVDRDSKYVEISCPNPLDKQIAINTIKHLIKSEAFDSNAIENIYRKEKRLIEQECVLTGKQYLENLNISVEDPNIFEYVGRLKYRWSFSQNVLEHCYETALICERLADKLGLDPQTAKEVGFFHDIGKSIDYERKYDHIDTGVKLAKQFQLPQEAINGIAKHHRSNCNEDYVLLVRCADAWSAARTGARHIPNANKDGTIQIIENKIKKIIGIKSFNVELENKDIRIAFLPDINNKSNCFAIKYAIIKAIKKDVRLNKYRVHVLD